MTIGVLFAALVSALMIGTGLAKMLPPRPLALFPPWFLLGMGAFMLFWSFLQMFFEKF
ncbi:hypothetical protein BOO71_0000367 [Deinococcus marmoris]|uniref:Uncharacterized protein n=1 Tax=Deinococcus marmoris TaxID=249408 RepID=A0A1U7P4L7_9DEIO|nr:hypothetical protein BOO71_0000367 [Deinococcus marmoris]